MSETRQPYTTTGDKTMRVGDEQYRKKLRRYNTLLFLDSPTARQSIEMAQLDRELTAAEMVHWRSNQ